MRIFTTMRSWRGKHESRLSAVRPEEEMACPFAFAWRKKKQKKM